MKAERIIRCPFFLLKRCENKNVVYFPGFEKKKAKREEGKKEVEKEKERGREGTTKNQSHYTPNSIQRKFPPLWRLFAFFPDHPVKR